MRAFLTVIMGYEGGVDLSKVSKGISKVPIMAPRNALPDIMEIIQYNAYSVLSEMFAPKLHTEEETTRQQQSTEDS